MLNLQEGTGDLEAAVDRSESFFSNNNSLNDVIC